MIRMALSLGLAGVLAAGFGCRMCSHPYDYSGPVYGDGNGYPASSPVARAGSILSGVPRATPAEAEDVRQYEYEELMEEDARLGDVPGSARIISVTDRAVEEDGASRITSSAPGEITPTASPRALPADGWTARRTAPDMRR